MTNFRHDHDIVPFPAPPPDMGGLLGRGSRQLDPNFETMVVRLTDGSDNRNQSMTTADTAGAAIWNHDDSMLLLGSPTGMKWIYQLNPRNLQATQLPYRYKGDVAFSRKTAGVLYQRDGTAILRHQFRRENGVWTHMGSSTLCDFANILPPGYQINWTGTMGVPQDDSIFLLAFSEGVQNTGQLVALWRRGHGAGKGYRLLNTETGQITGDWGEVGQAQLVQSDASFPFRLHEAVILPNPRYASVGPTKAGQLIWTIDSTRLNGRNVSGHAAAGYLHFYAGGPGGAQMAEVLYSDPTQVRPIVPPSQLPAAYGQRYDGDRHYGFGKMDALDNAWFWVTSAFGGETFTSCWQNEVFGYHALSGDVVRVCHTCNSTKSKTFIVAHAIGVPSQTGKFFVFTSDWMGTLGSTSGAETGTVGVDARGDVFLVELT